MFLIVILVPSNLTLVFAQTSSSNVSNLLVKLELTPSHIDTKNSAHSIGYVNLVNKIGISVKAPQDVVVQLESDDPTIASVPSDVTILKDQNYARFDVTIGNSNGETIISTIFNGKIDYKEFRVGGTGSSMPDDLKLKINLPTKQMHVNSEIPFSVFLQTPKGTVIRAPYDIDISLNYEESLLVPNVDKLEIKKGEYYAWGVLETFEDVGISFIKATYDDFQIDTAENIEITSSLPVGLAVNVFPSKVAAEVERSVDIFVSLIDSEGLPTVTPEDVRIELFADSPSVGKKLDETMEEKDLVIKKGQYGYHFRQEKLDLTFDIDKKITIGATARDLGIAFGSLQPVTPLSIDNPRAINLTLQVQMMKQIPSNTTSLMVYQIGAWGNLDRELLQFVCDEETGVCEEEVVGEVTVEHPIDLVPDDEFYPIQGRENYIAAGLGEKLNVISSDNSLLQIDDISWIESTSSYGTAIISSGQKTGEVTLAATVKELGAGFESTEIVDAYRHVKTKIFSPTGSNNIVLDKNGYFDLFLIAFDGKERPKVLEKETKYILSPVNQLLEIKKDHSFALANFHSDSFNAGLDESIEVHAVPIGVKAELDLETLTKFETQVSSFVEVALPFENLDADSQGEYQGIVQLKDSLGSPSIASKDLKIKLDLVGAEIVSIPQHVTIEQGSSYATFPIISNGENGDSRISASTKGVVGSETKISTASNLPKLKIFVNGLESPIGLEEPFELEVFVDDENAESVEGASIKFVTDAGFTVTPSDTRTNTEGSATVDLIVHNGPTVSLQILASAEGYVDGDQTFDYDVNEGMGSSLALGLPDWVLYVGIAAVVGIVAVLTMFLRKPKRELEEEEEDYEYDEI